MSCFRKAELYHTHYKVVFIQKKWLIRVCSHFQFDLQTHFPQGIAVNMLYPPVVPFFVIPILYPLNILLFGAVPTEEGFVKWKVWCYFQSQSFDLNKSLAQDLLVVVCRSSFIIDH